jgi:hypothetical protein
MQGLYQPNVDFDARIQAKMSAPLSMVRPILWSNGPVVSPQTSFYRSAQNIPTDNYQKPQFGRTDVSPVMQQPSDDGSRWNAGFQSWTDSPAPNAAAAFGNGITNPSTGRGTDAESYGDAVSSGTGRDAGSSEAISIAGEPPSGLSEIGYFEVPTNPTLAFSELWDIQQSNERAAVSRKDYISGVRDGNVRYNPDKSLDVTNGTVVTFSYKDGSAKTVTVTGDDIAHIDAVSGEVVIQKSF